MRGLCCIALASSVAGYAPSVLPVAHPRAASTRSVCAAMNLFGRDEESKTRRDSLSLRGAPLGSRKVTFRKPNTATQSLGLGLKFKESFGKARRSPGSASVPPRAHHTITPQATPSHTHAPHIWRHGESPRVAKSRHPAAITLSRTCALPMPTPQAVTIEKIIPGSEAARLEREGKIQKGDEIVMISATFGDEMWSTRGVGKYRVEKSIAVRQGMFISFVLEGASDSKKSNMAQMKRALEAEAQKMSRLQRQLQQEVDAEKSKGAFGGFFGGFGK